MQEHPTVVINADDLSQLAFYAAQGILAEADEADSDELVYADGEGAGRAQLGRTLAMAFAHGNLAADAQGQELPYAQPDILDAMTGALTRRPGELI
jgi:hypothetical protein